MRAATTLIDTRVHARVAAAITEPHGGFVVIGPKGTGRLSAVRTAVRRLDTLSGRVLDTGDHAMRAEQAREAVKHMRMRGARAVVGRLDGAHHSVANILLKSLEERDDAKLWVLTGLPGKVLPTVLSRVTAVRTPALTDAEVIAILTAMAVPAHEAHALARLGQGSISAALEARAEGRASNVVANLLRGLAEGNAGAISASLRGWGRPETLSLQTWAAECVSGQWFSFERDTWPPREGALAFAHSVLEGTWPSRVRVRALAWERVDTYRTRRGISR